MPEEDNGTTPEIVQLRTQPEQPQPQPGQVQLNIQVLPQGVMLSCAFPIQLGLPEETMDSLTEEWIMQRPQLLLKIVQRAKAAQQQGLAIIGHVNSTRNN